MDWRERGKVININKVRVWPLTQHKQEVAQGPAGVRGEGGGVQEGKQQLLSPLLVVVGGFCFFMIHFVCFEGGERERERERASESVCVCACV